MLFVVSDQNQCYLCFANVICNYDIMYIISWILLEIFLFSCLCPFLSFEFLMQFEFGKIISTVLSALLEPRVLNYSS